MTHPARRARSIVTTVAAMALAITGIVLIAVACAAQKTPPHPSAAAEHPPPTATSPTTARPRPVPRASPEFSVPNAPPTHGTVLPRSAPTAIDIPAIDVHSQLMTLGQKSDGTIQVPPLSRNSRAGWYDRSPTPGQLGPAVILGHIDSKAYGPAVFFKLGALKPGDTVAVQRSDHSTATFRVDKVAEYAKTTFPTRAVYGNIDHAGLRLITCSGTFDPSARSYDENIVVYASLISYTSTT